MYYLTPEHIETAKRNGISKDLATRRVYYRLWSIERAITTPPRKRSRSSGWDEWKETAKANGISNAVYHHRIKKQKMTPQEASTTPLQTFEERARKSAEKIQKYHLTPNQREKMESNGISYQTFHHRVKRQKMTIEQAVTTPIKSRKEIAHLSSGTQTMRLFNEISCNIQKSKIKRF